MTMDTFESLLAGLGRAGIDFLVVGGLAVAMAGFVRATEDVDILVEAQEENRPKDRLDVQVLQRILRGDAPSP